MTEEQYRRFVAHQRSLCDAHINLKLDELCVRNGFPNGAWRHWKFVDTIVKFKLDQTKFNEGIEKMQKTMAELGAAMTRNEVMAPNEIRKLMGLKPI